MSDEDGPLAFYQTDELIAELMRRYDHAVFAGIKDAPGDPDAYIRTARWQGNSDTVAGLCTRIGYLAIKASDEDVRPLADEDDR